MKRIKTPPPFSTKSLRLWAKRIQEAKDGVTAALTAPREGRTEFNLGKWNRMNSQQQKLFVFRAMEMGFITYEIGSYRKGPAVQVSL